MRNPKTTGLGIGAIITIVGNLLTQFFGGGEISGADIGTAITGIVTAFGLIFSKDAQTVEQTLVQPMAPAGRATLETKL